MRKIFLLLFVTATLLWNVTTGQAQVPHLMRYQGVLLDHSGQPLEGVHTLNFRIYDAVTGGNLLWNETQSAIPVTQGSFSVLLGQATSLNLLFDKDYYLTTEVDSDGEMSPRQKVTSSPYAMRAEVAERVDGTLYTAANGNVGIGTTNPLSKLDIQYIADVYTPGLKITKENGATEESGIELNILNPGGRKFWLAVTGANSGWGSSNFAIVDRTGGEDRPRLVINAAGDVGIREKNPTNILTVMQGSPTDPIADSWTVHPSDRAHKQVLGPAAGGYLDRVRSTPLYEWKRAPLVSDEEAKEALGVEHPTAEALEAKKSEIALVKASLPKFSTQRVGIVIDDENVPPEILTFHPDGTKAGIDLLAYIGYLHAALKEAALKINELESRLHALEGQ